MPKTCYKILDVKEFDLEFHTLIAKSMKIHLFTWVHIRQQQGVFINQVQVNEMLVTWQQNIIEDEKSNEH